MLKLVSMLIKLALFSVLILVLGHYIHMDGRTVSDHVKSHLSQAEGSTIARQLRTWAGSLAEDARSGHSRISGVAQGLENKVGMKVEDNIRTSSAAAERAPSERQKLRALIRELNSGQ
jgi:hypothetical protein